MTRFHGSFFWSDKLQYFAYPLKRQLGFSLMELLLVVVILGVLAAIGVPMLSGNIQAAKNADAQNTLKTIFLMEKNYFAENYCYYITPGTGDQTSNVNQYLMYSSTPTTGPIVVGSNNNFYFYIVPGTVGSSGSCIGVTSNDYVAYAQSRTQSTLFYSINQQNVKTGF